MAAFEEEHSRRLEQLQDSRAGSGAPSSEEIEYLLDVGMLIKDFYVNSDDAVALPRTQKKTKVPRKPRKRRELTAVEKSGSMQSWADVKTTRKDGALFKKYKDKFGIDSPTEHSAGLCTANPSSEESDICPTCRIPFVVDARESAELCTSCGFSRDFMEGSIANLTYDQENSMALTCNSPYERMNHLNEILAQVQGKETTPVPESILDAVRAEFKKDGIIYQKQVTPDAVLRYLKKLHEREWVRQPLIPCHKL